jgi:hypothetical protein
MRVLMFALLVPLAAFCADTPKKNAVLEPVENVDRFLPAGATNCAHILFVNVDGALPDAAFREAAAYVSMKTTFNVAVRNERKPFTDAAVADLATLRARFGGKAVIVVAFVKQEKNPVFMNIPGWFSQVNLRDVNKDSPGELFLKKRVRQMFLKGLAHACGVGATIDSMCVMHYNSFTLEGMDQVSATYGPNSYFPMLELLKKIGGNDIFIQR